MFLTIVKVAIATMLYMIAKTVIRDLPTWLQQEMAWSMLAVIVYLIVDRYFKLIKESAEMATREPRKVRRGQIVYVEWVCDRPAARCRVMETVRNNEKPIPLKLLENYGGHTKGDIVFAQAHEFMTTEEWRNRPGKEPHDEAL